MGYRLLSGGVAVALAATLAVPGAAQAASAAPKTFHATSTAASASAASTSARSAASAGASKASSAAAASRPEANTFRAVDGLQTAVPQVSAAVTGTPRATPSGPVLYVDAVSGAGCSDTASGAGTQAVPFCTLQAAANVVVAGDTVLVTPGANYQGFTLDAQGTADAPITFESNILPPTALDGNALIRVEPPLNTSGKPTPAHAIDVENSSYVDLEDFDVAELVTSDALLINASHNVTVNEFMDWVAYTPTAQTAPDIHVTGDSSYVTITRATEFNAYGQPYVRVDAGGSNDVIADSAFWANYGTTVSVAGTPNAEITGNSFLISGSTAISLTGASPDSTVEDNMVSFNNFPGTDTPSIVIGTGSTSGTTLDYNVVQPTGDPAYEWGTTTYDTATALLGATGQGTHEIDVTPDVYVGGDVLMLGYDAAGIDAADAAAPGEQATDILGESCVDDPSYSITGAGTPAYCSRGSFQYQDPLGAILTATETGSMSVSANATQSHGRYGISSYSFDFGDGTTPTVNTTGLAKHTYTHSGAYSVTVTVTDSTDATNTSGAVAVTTTGADFAAIAPTRILDTRKGIGTGVVQKVPAGGFVSFPVPTPDASNGKQITAVALNVTVTDATGNGYVGTSSYTSSLNYRAGQTLAATVIAPVGNGDEGTYYAQLSNSGSGSADLIADITGYFATDAADGYQPITPLRLMDTRVGTGGYTGKVTPAAPDVITVAGAGKGAIPSSGVTAVAVNLTVADTTGNGLVTAYPDGEPAPGTSNLNFTAGQILSNFAIVPVGTDGEIDIADTNAPTDVIIDVVGYFDTTGGSAFVVTGPYRDIDTRSGNPTQDCSTDKGALAAKGGLLTANPVCAAYNLAPSVTGDVTAVAVNDTVTEGTSSGYLTTYPAGGTRPDTSDLDWQQANENVANLTFAGTGDSGEVTFANESSGTTQLIVDVYGFFADS